MVPGVAMPTGNPNQVFPFLLGQSDQGDLDRAKKENAYRDDPKFRQVIDEAFKTAPPAGSRHQRYFERARAKLATNTLDTVYGTKMWQQEPGSILASYLVGEEMWAKEIGRMKLGKREGQRWKRTKARCQRCAKFCDFENNHFTLNHM